MRIRGSGWVAKCRASAALTPAAQYDTTLRISHTTATTIAIQTKASTLLYCTSILCRDTAEYKYCTVPVLYHTVVDSFTVNAHVPHPLQLPYRTTNPCTELY